MMQVAGGPGSAARVYAYIVRDGRVAVFDHPDPDAGVQVPGGGVEAGESLVDAVMREVREESGLECEVVAHLGRRRRQGWYPDRGPIDSMRHYFELRPLGPVAETWTWTERHASDGSGPHEFAFRWLPVAEAGGELDFGFGEMLDVLMEPGVGDDPAGLVGAGYDRLTRTYPAWSRSASAGNQRHVLIDRAVELGATGPALDIGCGTGELATARLVERGLRVVGIDVSPASIARARRALPGEQFLAADVRTLSLPLRHFGLVTAFNSVIHVPRRRHDALFRDVRRWLRPGGVFVLNVETQGQSGEGTTAAWLDGVDMFWSAWTADEEIALLERAGLIVAEAAAETTQGGTPFTWLICRRPA
jgi:SAM-dependent methyltransferase/8-oxo-dGTP pyrophosphatase MutT (NUDIX family)